MQWLEDIYTVLAGDVAVAYAGRAYNCKTHQFETVSGINMGSSKFSHRRLKSIDFIVHSPTGTVKDGIWCCGYVVIDELHTGMVAPWFNQIQSKAHLIQWQGDIDMGCGFFWRIHAGGLVAGDVVGLGVGYE